ncbi:hypothetical protein CL689_01125 [Candidatus Saccharibacteria bacterium]|nr:hypothetical protein [Candidatus Saccharibacteria bacterium]MBJ58448.1 hypothetical protein [Candidatus Saccharibacteria bacterium]MBQ68652.1 hypothetical protein [Candidatus Saccharibacteria bacterium]|tara:strand:- start:332 stop:793 length:462 start_codon:yes stop_codon:yes gene_type:complete
MKQHSGFTIVELLIVIVVIAILAAITIVAYNGIQNQAYDTTVKSDMSNNAKKLQVYLSQNSTFPSSPTTSLGLRASKDAYLLDRNNFYVCFSADGTKFALSGISKSGTAFAISSDTALQQGGVGGGDATCDLIGGGSWSAGRGSSNVWASWAG